MEKISNHATINESICRIEDTPDQGKEQAKQEPQEEEISIVEATQEEIEAAAWKFTARYAHSRRFNQAYHTELPELTVSSRYCTNI